ncbi:MAG TPA: ATP-binding protein [Arsenicitalea sp.]|nr:ATP-binding protein [Arsenicitalea sp.]
MQPDGFRKRCGFAVLCAAPLTLLSAVPALAAGFNTSVIVGAAPLTIGIGAVGFGIIALAILRTLKHDGRLARQMASEQIANLRARVDEYEAVLSGAREVTIMWTEHADGPRFLGQASLIIAPGRRPEALLDFPSWLADASTQVLVRALQALKIEGHSFDLSLKARDGRGIRAAGWVIGGGVALRLRPAFEQQPSKPEQPAEDSALVADPASARAILAMLSKPAFVRDGSNRLVFGNAAYQQLVRTLGKKWRDSDVPELVEPGPLAAHLAALADSAEPQMLALDFETAGAFELFEFPIVGGTAGYLRPKLEQAAPAPDTSFSHIAGVIDALATPVAIFDARRELIQFNRAYATLWNLDPKWLRTHPDERAILDRLRGEGLLPNEPDYHAWRAKHLASYALTAPRPGEPWHLPDGRTVMVTAAPAGPAGGVIYVFEDMTARLELERRNKALGNVQRETLNALSEGVAVFGTNGRLTLSNPRLSLLWKLPMNELGQNPHIDQIAAASARAMPDDGAGIWRDLKRGIIDLNPTRADTAGRIARADGRLLDYAIVRLPDGQTMMTFLDVTESANYQRVLTERNEALITADRLKDAFVQNVSYELRSPLTNIIGFADLLATDEVGTLNARQRSYTDYIRASSVTLGVLIDNILDLATVDAGIAELRPELQDVHALIDKARAGLAATFPEINGEKTLNLVVDVADDLPPFLADGTRIVQVLYNLLSNAARFSEPGGEIHLSVEARGERMLFVVEDEGAPMSDEMKAAILERVDNPAIAGRQRGAGLGLAIVRTFVNLHGGTITVERREPRGSRVTVNLPRDAAMAQHAAE